MDNHDRHQETRAFRIGRAFRWAFVGLVCVALVAGALAQTGNPKIELTAESVDLGEVDRGAVVTTSFEVRNTGQADLRTLDVKPG